MICGIRETYQDAEKLCQRRSRIAQTLNEDPAASPLGGAQKRGAPYSSHPCAAEGTLPVSTRLRPCWTSFLSILYAVILCLRRQCT
jgi:hypothetical protein